MTQNNENVLLPLDHKVLTNSNGGKTMTRKC